MGERIYLKFEYPMNRHAGDSRHDLQNALLIKPGVDRVDHRWIDTTDLQAGRHCSAGVAGRVPEYSTPRAGHVA